MLLRRRDLRFIENAEGNGVWEWAGCIEDYDSVPSAKESGGAGDFVACQQDSQASLGRSHPSHPADAAPPDSAHTQSMSEETVFDLQAYSQALTKLIGRAGEHVVAVAAAAYRVSSGVVFRDGLIAVNSHALRREGKIPVTLSDGSEIQAAIIGREPAGDTAILQIERGRAAAAIPEDDPQALQAGALAVVVGRTLDAGLSASVGILGAVGAPRRTWRGGNLTRFLRLDVNLYPSQAGAAVISPAGKLIGMATGAMSRHSALAIPVDTLDRNGSRWDEESERRAGVGTPAACELCCKHHD